MVYVCNSIGMDKHTLSNSWKLVKTEKNPLIQNTSQAGNGMSELETEYRHKTSNYEKNCSNIRTTFFILTA